MVLPEVRHFVGKRRGDLPVGSVLHRGWVERDFVDDLGAATVSKPLAREIAATALRALHRDQHVGQRLVQRARFKLGLF